MRFRIRCETTLLESQKRLKLRPVILRVIDQGLINLNMFRRIIGSDFGLVSRHEP